MATKTPLTDTELKTLEITRQRLSALTSTLNSLRTALLNSDPLPPPSSLSTQSAILSTTLSAYQTHLSASTPLLSRLAVFPSAQFPGRDAERVGLVQNLVKRRMDDRAQAWVEEGRGVGGVDGQMKELWEWAGPEANGLARKYAWGVGGESEDEDEEDEEDEDEDMEDGKGEEEEVEDVIVVDGDAMGVGDGVGKVEGGEVKKPLTLEEVMRFMTTGKKPGS